MAGVPFVFGNATTSIPLSNLDANFNTGVTIGNTTVGLGNTVTTLGNVTLNNVTINSGLLSTATIPTANGTVMISGNMPAFSATLASTQSVTSATYTKAVLATELYDTNSYFDNTTNYRFTPLIAGYYMFVANALVQNTGTGTVALVQIKKNALTVAQNEFTATFANGLSLPVSTIQFMNGSTDYIELFLYNNAAVNPSFGAGQENTVLSGILIRAT